MEMVETEKTQKNLKEFWEREMEHFLQRGEITRPVGTQSRVKFIAGKKKSPGSDTIYRREGS